MTEEVPDLEKVAAELDSLGEQAATEFCRKMFQAEAVSVRRRIEKLKQELSKPASPPASVKAPHITVVDDIAEDACEQEISDDELSGHLSDPEEELAREARLKERVAQLKELYGVEDERTIKKVLKLVSVLIGQYKLDDTDEYLDMVSTAAAARGEADSLNIKCIQSRAFCLWKRYRYKEALVLFHQQERIMGPSAALCENIGHTYNSMGNYEQAEKYFTQAMEMLKHGSFGNKGGIYLGLGLVRERLGKTKEALPILQQALSHYQDEYNKGGEQLDSSLIAKSHMSVAHALENLNQLDDAVYHVREALRVFRKTVGNSSPLVANALHSLGRMLQAKGELDEADTVFRHSLNLEVHKDAFHLETIFKLLNSIKELHTANPKPKGSLSELHGQVRPLLKPIRDACARIHQLEMISKHTDDGTVAVFYKTAGELTMLAGEYAEAIEHLSVAAGLLRIIPDFDCTSLVESTDYMLEFAKGQLKSTEGAITQAQEPRMEVGNPMPMVMPPAHNTSEQLD